MGVHILRTGKGWTRWRVASDWYSNVTPEQKLFTDCCACNVRAADAKVRIEQLRSVHQGYWEPRHQVVCRAMRGCNANPRKRRGMSLRQWCHYG